jgi:hypothetical protein
MMFDLKRPCRNCPFRVGWGSKFRFPRARFEEIVHATSFVCHKTTVDDDEGEGECVAGPKAQECAGLMAVLTREKRPNQMMRIAIRLGWLNPEKLDPDAEAYLTLRAARAAHAGKEPT